MSYLLKFLKSVTGAFSVEGVVLTTAAASMGFAIAVGVAAPTTGDGEEIAAEAQEMSLHRN